MRAVVTSIALIVTLRVAVAHAQSAPLAIERDYDADSQRTHTGPTHIALITSFDGPNVLPPPPPGANPGLSLASDYDDPRFGRSSAMPLVLITSYDDRDDAHETVLPALDLLRTYDGTAPDPLPTLTPLEIIVDLDASESTRVVLPALRLHP